MLAAAAFLATLVFRGACLQRRPSSRLDLNMKIEITKRDVRGKCYAVRLPARRKNYLVRHGRLRLWRNQPLCMAVDIADYGTVCSRMCFEHTLKWQTELKI